MYQDYQHVYRLFSIIVLYQILFHMFSASLETVNKLYNVVFVIVLIANKQVANSNSHTNH